MQLEALKPNTVIREQELVRHLSKKELERFLTKTDEIKVYKRLVFLKFLYGEATLAEAASDVGVSEGTASNWVECWNVDGLGKSTPNFGSVIGTANLAKVMGRFGSYWS